LLRNGGGTFAGASTGFFRRIKDRTATSSTRAGHTRRRRVDGAEGGAPRPREIDLPWVPDSAAPPPAWGSPEGSGPEWVPLRGPRDVPHEQAALEHPLRAVDARSRAAPSKSRYLQRAPVPTARPGPPRCPRAARGADAETPPRRVPSMRRRLIGRPSIGADAPAPPSRARPAPASGRTASAPGQADRLRERGLSGGVSPHCSAKMRHVAPLSSTSTLRSLFLVSKPPSGASASFKNAFDRGLEIVPPWRTH